MDYNERTPITWRNHLNTYTEPFFTTMFTIEMVLKIIAYGFILGDNTYLKDKWNWIDFMVVITSLLSSMPSFGNYSAFRTFRLLRPLRSLNSLQNMKLLVSTLLSSLAQLGEILIFATFFFLIFSIMGVSLWAGDIHYRCRETPSPVDGDWIAVSLDPALCGYRSCPKDDNGDRTYCGSLIEAHDKWHTVNVSNVYRDTQIPELNFGLVTFDNVLIAMLTIFQCITLEGWTTMMYYFSDAYFPVATHIYFILLVIICSFFILNLTIAILLDNYAEGEKGDGGLASNMIELIESGKEAGLPNEVIDFIIHQDISTTKKKRKNNMMRRDSMQSFGTSMNQSSLGSNVYKNFYLTFVSHEIVVPQTKYYTYKITRWMYMIANHALFNSSIMFIIGLNTIMLSFERYPEPTDIERNTFYICNIVFTALFSLEVIIKLIAFSVRGFVRDKFNVFDAIVVLVSVIELSVLNGGTGSSLSALRAFRLFRVFKIFRVGDLRVLMDSIGLTILGMGNYTVLMMLFVYLYALLGMQFFAGKFTFNSDGLYDYDGSVSRVNFDTIWDSFITIIIIMIGDNWNNVMYSAMLAEGTMYCLYFVSLYTLGNIIMLNLFLAILLGNFDSARQLMAKKKAFDEFKKLHKKKVPLLFSLEIVLGDLGTYIENNVLKDDDKVEFVNQIAEANIPNQNIEPKTYSVDNIEPESMVKVNTMNPVVEEQKFQLPKIGRDGNFPGFDSQEFGIHNDFGKSHDSLDNLFIKKQGIDNILVQTGQTKQESTLGLNKLVDSPFAREHNFAFKSVDNLREKPSNQQEGDAYDKELDDLQKHLESKKSSKSSVSEDFKKSQVDDEDPEDEDEDSKDLEKSHKPFYPDQRAFSSINKHKTPNSKHSQNTPFDSDDSEVGYKFAFCGRLVDYLKHSSLFIFHENWSVRQFLITTIISTEFLTNKLPKQLKPKPQEGEEEASGADSNKTQTESEFSVDEEDENTNRFASSAYYLSHVVIIDKKIITTKRNIRISKWFENIIIGLIIVNSFALIMDNPLEDPTGGLSKTFYYLDIVFTICFTIEAVMKIIALGFFYNCMPGIDGYIMNGWNILDFIIVVASLVDLGFTLSNSNADTESLKSLKALRAFRALRPLRVISRNEGLQIVVNTLFSSLPALKNVMMVTALILLIFAIMGVEFFKGTFYSCQLDSSLSVDQINSILANVISKHD